MKTRHLLRIAALAGAIVQATAAHAGRPLQTEDAGVLAPGESELESFAGWQRADGVATERTASIQFGYGVGGATQLALQLARASAHDEHVAQLNLVGKTGLRELTETQAGFALAWTLAGERPRGGSARLQGYELRAVASAPIDAWTAHANVGHARDRRAHQSTTLWALAVEHATTPRLDLMLETFGDDRDRDPWLNAGVRYAAIAQRLFLDASFGRQTGGSGARLITVGLKLAW